MTNEEMAARIQAGEAGIMSTLIEENRGLLWSVARKYLPAAIRNRALDMDDLLQAAALGLIEAVPKWEESRGAFVTLAVLYIRRSIRAALGIHTSKERIENMGAASLDVTIGEDGNTPLVDLLQDKNAVDPAQAAEVENTRLVIREAVDRLSPAYQRAVKARWFGEGEPDKSTYARATEACCKLRRDPAIRELMEAAPYHHRGLASWRHTNTSSTEAAAMRREQLRQTMATLHWSDERVDVLIKKYSLS